jgi:DNA-3-methyladenine glycosylase
VIERRHLKLVKPPPAFIVPGKGEILPMSYYQRDTVQVAKDLLGKQLVHKVGRKRLAGIIVETEAYTGIEDAACHAFGGRRSEKNESLYLEGGHAYIYFIYGMYYCLNVVTESHGCPEAVLIRGIEPTEGIDVMMENRGRKTTIKKPQELSNGPGKLCTALDLDRRQDGLPLVSKELFIEDVGLDMPDRKIVKASRIGVDYAGEAASWPLRFYIRDNPYVSRY